MAKRFLFYVLALLFFVAGCSGVLKEKPYIEGYVTDKEDGRILVVSPEPKDANDNGNADFYDALWGSDAPDRIEIG
ncbi:DUF3221 domain-containing protein [Halobacillus sp. K22]|uniref:DUF3221 domain-containing protein n=1 Tax=Halobacillus sp. K22 TaxID=3457431 RepID=UPI003FCE30CE